MTAPRIISRAGWKARHGTGSPDPGPEGEVVIHHSYRPALSPGATMEEEIAAIQGIERYHAVNQGWSGIGYNFLVAPSGRTYEGRGWGFRGAHAGPVNSSSIGICLLIDGNKTEPTPEIIQAVRDLIGLGIDIKEISARYKLSGHRDHMPRECPGNLVYARLPEFRHDAPGAQPDLPEPEVDLKGDEWVPEPLPSLEPVSALRSPVRAVAEATAGADETTGAWLRRMVEWLAEQPEVGAFTKAMALWVIRVLTERLEEG